MKDICLIYGCLMGFIFLFGFLGNSAIIVVNSRSAKDRKRYLYTLNLALMSAAVALCSGFKAYYAYVDAQPSSLVCNAEAFTSTFLAISTIHQLTVVSVEKAWMVCKPFAVVRIKAWRRYLSTFAVYVTSFLTSAPPLLNQHWGQYDYVNARWYCSFDYKNRHPHSRVYVFALCLVAYVCPLVIIICCYMLILQKVRASDRYRRQRACTTAFDNTSKCSYASLYTLRRKSLFHGLPKLPQALRQLHSANQVVGAIEPDAEEHGPMFFSSPEPDHSDRLTLSPICRSVSPDSSVTTGQITSTDTLFQFDPTHIGKVSLTIPMWDAELRQVASCEQLGQPTSIGPDSEEQGSGVRRSANVLKKGDSRRPPPIRKAVSFDLPNFSLKDNTVEQPIAPNMASAVITRTINVDFQNAHEDDFSPETVVRRTASYDHSAKSDQTDFTSTHWSSSAATSGRTSLTVPQWSPLRHAASCKQLRRATASGAKRSTASNASTITTPLRKTASFNLLMTTDETDFNDTVSEHLKRQDRREPSLTVPTWLPLHQASGCKLLQQPTIKVVESEGFFDGDVAHRRGQLRKTASFDYSFGGDQPNSDESEHYDPVVQIQDHHQIIVVEPSAKTPQSNGYAARSHTPTQKKTSVQSSQQSVTRAPSSPIPSDRRYAPMSRKAVSFNTPTSSTRRRRRWFSQRLRLHRHRVIWRQYRLASGVFMIVLSFVLTWIPYAVVVLCAQLRDVDSDGMDNVPVFASVLTNSFALWNPIVYGLLDREFRARLCSLLTGRPLHPPPQRTSMSDALSMLQARPSSSAVRLVRPQQQTPAPSAYSPSPRRSCRAESQPLIRP